MRLLVIINLPVLLLTLAVGSFALPIQPGQNPDVDCSSNFFFLTALFFLFNPSTAINIEFDPDDDIGGPNF